MGIEPIPARSAVLGGEDFDMRIVDYLADEFAWLPLVGGTVSASGTGW